MDGPENKGAFTGFLHFVITRLFREPDPDSAQEIRNTGIFPVSARATPAGSFFAPDRPLYWCRISPVLFPVIPFTSKYIANFLKHRIKAKITNPAPFSGDDPGQGYRGIPAYPAAP